MRIAVTGGTGCLGRPLVNRLIKEGFEVNLLVRSPNDSLPKAQNVRAIPGHINSPADLEMLTRGCKTVFHLAGKVHTTGKSQTDSDDFHSVNVDGTRLLIEAARKNGVERIVFYSTIGVYGKDSDFYGDELSPCNPRSAYAASKLSAERFILESGESSGPQGVVLRFPVTYGPFDRGNVAALISAVYKKQFFFFGDGSCLRSMISSENTAQAALRAAFEPAAAGGIFCVTDGTDYTLLEIIDAIRDALKLEWKPRCVPLWLAFGLGLCGDLAGLARIPFPLNSSKVRKLSGPLVFSCQKAKQVLGYLPRESLTQGISREVEWLKAVNGWN